MTRGPLRRLLDRLRRSSGADEPALTTPREMALENAAEALGEELGSYYVEEWEVPEGELEDAERTISPEIRDRIDARREEAVLFVRREGARQRRRRSRRIAVAITAASAVAAGTALVLGVGSRDARERKSTERSSDGPYPAPIMPRSPTSIPAPVSNSVAATVARGDGRFQTSAYVGAGGFICSSLDYVRHGVAERRSIRGCTEPQRLRRDLARFHAVFASVQGEGEGVVLEGYASRDVESIGGRGWAGELDVGLSRAWSPEAAGLADPLPSMAPFRAFLAVAQPDFGARPTEAEGNRALDFEGYGLKARLADGRVVRVRLPPPEL